MKKSIRRIDPLDAYQVSLFGGGDMKTSQTSTRIGQANIYAAREWLEQEKLKLHQQDVGGTTPRIIKLDMRTGEVSVKYSKPISILDLM